MPCFFVPSGQKAEPALHAASRLTLQTIVLFPSALRTAVSVVNLKQILSWCIRSCGYCRPSGPRPRARRKIPFGRGERGVEAPHYPYKSDTSIVESL